MLSAFASSETRDLAFRTIYQRKTAKQGSRFHFEEQMSFVLFGTRNFAALDLTKAKEESD